MIDVIAMLKHHRVPHLAGSGHHHARNGWVQVHCPFCSGGRDGWKLGYSLIGRGWACWVCGPVNFWRAIAGALKVSEADAKVAARPFRKDTRATIVLPKYVPRSPILRRDAIRPPPGCGPFQPEHVRYLARRGFNPEELADDWGMMGTGHLGGAWAWRVVIPVRNTLKMTVAFQGRTIGNATPRYKMTDDADCLEPPDTLVYGVDRVPGDTVVVVEGALKVARIGPGAVATLGIGWKSAQVVRLRRYKRRFIMFDPEPLAQRRAKLLAKALSMYPGTTEIVDGLDAAPDEFGPETVKNLRKMLKL